MSEITDLSQTDASNTAVTGYSTVGSIANMGTTDNLFQAILGLLKRSFRANLFRVYDSSDATKLVAFDVSGVTTATTRTLVVPDRNGEVSLAGGNVLVPVGTTSGTDVTVASSLPTWLSQITLNFNAVSTSGNARVKIQLGTSGGFVSTGYLAGSAQVGSSTAVEEYTDGFGLRIFNVLSASVYGSVTFTRQSVSQDVWIASGVVYDSDSGGTMGLVSGIIILASALTQIRVTTLDTFDQGSINAVYS